jgi:RecA-family ATPase
MSPEERLSHLGMRQSPPLAIVAPLDERSPPPVGALTDKRVAAVLEWFTPVDLVDKSVPPRRWLVRDMIPDRQVTLLAGDGATGKSQIAQQLAVATALGTEWIGQLPEPGPVVFASAEDDRDELHRRLVAIAASYGMDLSDMADLHLASLAGRDAVMGAPDKTGIIRETAVWRGLAEKVDKVKPRLVVIDPLADVFAGNENDRPEARQFVGLLRRLAIHHACAVLLLGHPSLTGLSTGAGTSGSTAWSNSVRSRLYLERPKGDDGKEIDPDLRALKVKKSNYGPIGDELRLRWDNGTFRLDGQSTGPLDRLAAEAKAEHVFLNLLQDLEAQGRHVSSSPSSSYAPSVFAKHPDRAGIAKSGFHTAMERLLKRRAIAVVETGPQSRRRSRLVIVAHGELA